MPAVNYADYCAEKDPNMRPGKQAMRTYEAVNPVVETCLGELTAELQELLAWAETSGAAPEAWGFDPVSYLSDALKLRNPSRASMAAKKAMAAAAAESKYPTGAAAAAASPAAPPPAAAAAAAADSDFSPIEAEVIVEALRHGAVFSAGSRLGLVRVDAATNELVVATPQPAPSASEEEKRVAYLMQARGRIAKEHPPVFGTGLPPAPPPPTLAAEKRIPVRDAVSWIVNGGWKSVGMEAALAAEGTEGGAEASSLVHDGMAKTFLAASFARPQLASDLLTAAPSDSLDLAGFASATSAAAQVVAEEAAKRDATLATVAGVGPALLATPAVGEALARAPALSSLSASSLGSSWVAGQTRTPPASTLPAHAWAALGDVIERAPALKALTTGAQAACPSEVAALAAAVSASKSLEALSISGLTHVGLSPDAVTPFAPPTFASFGATPATLAPMAPLAADDEARSAAVAQAIAAAFSSPIKATIAIGATPTGKPQTPPSRPLSASITPKIKLSTLSSFACARCGLGDDAMTILCHALAAAKPPLAALDVAANPFGEAGALALSDLLSSNELPLKSLDCSGSVSGRGTPLALGALTEGLGASKLEAITWQTSGGAPAGRHAAHWGLQLATALEKKNVTIAMLDLSGHCLGSDSPFELDPASVAALRESRAMAALGSGCRRHHALSLLNLSGCKLHDAGLSLLLSPLHDHPNLAALDLSGSFFGRAAAGALAALLRDSRALTSLAICRSEMASEAFCVVAASLAMNATLSTLDLSHNPLGVSDGLGPVVAEAAPPSADGGEEGEAPPPAEEEAADPKAAPEEPTEPDLPAVAAAKAIARVIELCRSLTSLTLRGCSLDQPEPPEPPAPPAAAPAEEALDDEEQDTGGKGEPPPPAEGEEAEAEAPPPPPPPPPVLGALIGGGMSAALASALSLLDLRQNALGDAGVEALADGLVGCPKLRALYLSGCASEKSEAALAKGLAAQGAVVLCDLAGGVAGVASGEDDDALQVVLAANRYEHTLLWDELLALCPAKAAEAVTSAFRSLPGATSASVPLSELVGRLVDGASLVAIDTSPPGKTLPFGGFVQWVADFFAGTWDETLGASSRFAHLMRALAAPHVGGGGVATDEIAAEPEWLHHAASALCVQTRRYYQRPKPKPRKPDDADELCGAAQATLWNMLGVLDEAAAPAEEAAEAPAEGGEAAEEPAAEAAAAEASGEGAGEEVVVAPAPAEPVDPFELAEQTLAPLLGCSTLASLVSSPEELLHPQLPADLYTTCAKDVLDKTYRLEMQATLRLEENASAPGKGQKPESTHLDISQRPTQRNYYDDWDFFLDEVRPEPLTEWRYCLSWLCRGTKDGTTTASCLSRTEATLAGGAGGGADEAEGGKSGVVTRSEVLLERPFSAGSLRCVLSMVDGGPFLISGLQVLVNKEYIPEGPLLTWHDTEPFREAPPEEPAAEEAEAEAE